MICGLRYAFVKQINLNIPPVQTVDILCGCFKIGVGAPNVNTFSWIVSRCGMCVVTNVWGSFVKHILIGN